MFRLCNLCEKTHLEYALTPVDHAVIFQVTSQSADITEFLKSNTYRASNGLLIAGSEYPEFKDSKNTIFLQGTNRSANYKLDVTKFVSNTARDNKVEMFKQALKEFVGYIKKLRNSYGFVTMPAAKVKNHVPNYVAIVLE